MDSRLDHRMWRQLLATHRDKRQSLQAQVRHMLVAAMLDGLLPPDSCLPSTRELAEALGISRNTVILVYQQLADDGYVTTRLRQGYFVSSQAHQTIKHTSGSLATAADNDRAARLWEGRLRQRPSRQRNIEKPTQWGNYPYPFLYGQFDAAHFPTADWRHCCLRSLNQLEVHDWGQDMFLRDDPSLIQQIRTRLLPQRGIRASEAEVMLTVGAQHGLYLLADLLIDDSSKVGFEEPGYPDARNIFAHRGATLVPIPVDSDGLVVGKALRGCQLVYTTPSHQCPTTVTMPLTRRQALLAQSEREDFVIIEDDYETENRADGEHEPALKSLDQSHRVVYVGSLSKSLAPGLRIGYVVGPELLIAELRAMRRLNIRHPNAFIQRAVAMFLGLGHHNALQRKQAAVHAERSLALVESLRQHLPACSFKPESRGSAFWVQAPPGVDSRVLARMAEAQGVLIEPGDVFYMHAHQPCRHFRMGFTSIESTVIDDGVRALKRALEQTLAATARGEYSPPTHITRVKARHSS